MFALRSLDNANLQHELFRKIVDRDVQGEDGDGCKRQARMVHLPLALILVSVVAMSPMTIPCWKRTAGRCGWARAPWHRFLTELHAMRILESISVQLASGT